MAFSVDMGGIVDFMEAFLNSLPNRLVYGTHSVAEQMEAYAKQNAPWTDRTGNARRTLSGFVDSDESNLYIGVAGHMPYSPLLELYYGGRFKIILPTVDAFAPTIMSAAISAAMSFRR